MLSPEARPKNVEEGFFIRCFPMSMDSWLKSNAGDGNPAEIPKLRMGIFILLEWMGDRFFTWVMVSG
jgi:hypothetical protein